MVLLASIVWSEVAMADANIVSWNFKYLRSEEGTDWHWKGSGLGDGAEVYMGICDRDFYIDGAWVKTWSSSDWKQNKASLQYDVLDGCTFNCKYTYYVDKTNVTGDQTWEYTSWNVNIKEKCGGQPGEYRVGMSFGLEGCCSAGGTIYFTIPGFKSQSGTSLAFGSVNQGSSSNANTITYNHYGTLLDLSNCSIVDGGGNPVDYFTITSVSESGVSVKFAPKSTTSLGDKTAYLNITDAHSKSISQVTLTGAVLKGAEVQIGRTPAIGKGPIVTLSGYLSNAGCSGSVTESYRPYGFYYMKADGNTCDDITSGSTLELSGSAISTGTTWDGTITSGLEENTEYIYKPYVKLASDPSNVTVSNGECGTFTTAGGCDYPTGDVIYYTIDASAQENPCELVFQTFEAALANLRTHDVQGSDDYWWNSEHSMIKKNIVFQVAVSEAGYGREGGRLDLSDINKFNPATSVTPTKRFTIKPLVDDTKPVLYGLNLANSRWVTVESMDVRRDAPSSSDGIGHACILVGLNSSSNNLEVGYMTSSGLEFKDCLMEGKNFCCIHANGVNGLLMENCNLVAAGDDETTSDTFNWGASIKFMNCKNITLLRNNFKGAHANNIFAQNSQYMLIMENVFWNDNAVTRGSNSSWNYKSIIRLINYGASEGEHDIENIGMYYNTMYLANSATHADKTDFLTIGGQYGDQTQDVDRYDFSTIDFKYNNCYSYDTDTPGKSPSPFGSEDVSSSEHIAYNNFWSKYDKEQNDGRTVSDFAFGNNVLDPYVSLDPGDGMVCETVPNTPEGIIIKGKMLNSGIKMTKDDDITGLGAETITTDRKYNERPSVNTWSYGAFQTAVGANNVEEIIWHATTAEEDSDGDGKNDLYFWDHRSNWYRRDANGKLVALTCVDNLAENLKVIIPDKDDPTYGSMAGYPQILEWDDPRRYGESSRYGRYGAEAVFAGADGKALPSDGKYSDNIELKYGAALLGVENLSGHYTSATSNLTVPRKEWVLVGSVLKPFDKKTGDPRYTVSEDFYIQDHLPHVYMQQFEWDDTEETVSWTYPFTQLDEVVTPSTSFAILVADQYGPYKLPASVYYTREAPEDDPDGTLANSGTDPYTYTHTGVFAYDNTTDAKLTIAVGANIYNNAYPAVMNATTLDTNLNTLFGSNNYALQLYVDGAWTAFSNLSDEEKYIKPQSGFMIQNNTGASQDLTVSASLFAPERSTKLRLAYFTAGIVLYAYNTATSKGSRVGIWQTEPSSKKVFNGSILDNAEIYAIGTDGKYSSLNVEDMSSVVPLGIRNKSENSMSVKIELFKAENIESAILEDRGVEPVARYDLLKGEAPVFKSLPSGDTEGRFFLNLNYAEEESLDITTVTEHSDNQSEDIDIEIFAVKKDLTIATAEDVVIENIVITDMVGRSFDIEPADGNYSTYRLNITNGTYIVTVVTNKKTVQQKVLLTE